MIVRYDWRMSGNNKVVQSTDDQGKKKLVKVCDSVYQAQLLASALNALNATLDKESEV